MPKVATKGGTRRFVTSTPLPKPTSAPSASAIKIAGMTSSSRPLVTSATTIEVMRKMPPTDRVEPGDQQDQRLPNRDNAELRCLPHDNGDGVDIVESRRQDSGGEQQRQQRDVHAVIGDEKPQPQRPIRRRLSPIRMALPRSFAILIGTLSSEPCHFAACCRASVRGGRRILVIEVLRRPLDAFPGNRLLRRDLDQITRAHS